MFSPKRMLAAAAHLFCTLWQIRKRILNTMAEKKKKTPKLNKVMRNEGGTKKYKVYVKNDKGNVVKVTFGDPNMEIRRDNPDARKAFRARHNCDNPGPRWKAKYWACKLWSDKSVSDILDDD